MQIQARAERAVTRVGTSVPRAADGHRKEVGSLRDGEVLARAEEPSSGLYLRSIYKIRYYKLSGSMTTSQISSGKSPSHKNSGKRNGTHAFGEYGGWTLPDHIKFIESKLWKI